MNSEISIRPFRSQDQHVARELILEGLGDHFGFIDKALNPDLDNIAETFAKDVFLCAWNGDELIGTGALIRESERVSRIVRMSVSKKMRRRGIGRMILSALVTASRERGDLKIVLETTETWHDVIAFYRNFGFALTHFKDGEANFEMGLGFN
jgi:GNAT superfamily N-acetyltransferase